MKAMTHEAAFLCGAGLGACLMYYFDPRMGPRRRALLRDQMVAQCNQAQRMAGKTWRDTRNRAYGMASEAGGMFHEDDATDEVIEARIRASLGHVASHPRSIEVEVHDGCVTLNGTAPADEADQVMKTVWGVRGVCDVESRLNIEETAETTSGEEGRA